MSDYESFSDSSEGSDPFSHPEKNDVYLEYRILSPQELELQQQSIISQISSVLGISNTETLACLVYFNWNKDSLLENYLTNPTKIRNAVGLTATVATNGIDSDSFIECDICCESTNTSFALECGHRYCLDCWKNYLHEKIKDQGECRRIQCPGNCNLMVNESIIGQIVDHQVLEWYHKLLMRTFVEDSKYLKWCPSPNCEYAVECKVSGFNLYEIVPTVLCKCGHAFCFGCLLNDHQPCICPLVKLWLKKCADDSETSNWISANTKECSKCNSSIEKNGGCNHMSCKKCKHEFCWVCLGPWSEHGSQFYSCNRYEEKTSVDARDQQSKSRAALERYLHFYNRYANHQQSAKLDKELYEQTEKKMEEMQRSSDLSWIEVQYLRKAVEVLLKSRTTLMWTYAFAYYLAKNNATVLFEDNQRDLEMAVESLSELLEKPVEPATVLETKQLILDKTVYVGSRREIVLKDTLNGLAENRWSYNVEI